MIAIRFIQCPTRPPQHYRHSPPFCKIHPSYRAKKRPATVLRGSRHPKSEDQDPDSAINPRRLRLSGSATQPTHQLATGKTAATLTPPTGCNASSRPTAPHANHAQMDTNFHEQDAGCSPPSKASHQQPATHNQQPPLLIRVHSCPFVDNPLGCPTRQPHRSYLSASVFTSSSRSFSVGYFSSKKCLISGSSSASRPSRNSRVIAFESSTSPPRYS